MEKLSSSGSGSEEVVIAEEELFQEQKYQTKDNEVQ